MCLPSKMIRGVVQKSQRPEVYEEAFALWVVSLHYLGHFLSTILLRQIGVQTRFPLETPGCSKLNTETVITVITWMACDKHHRYTVHDILYDMQYWILVFVCNHPIGWMPVWQLCKTCSRPSTCLFILGKKIVKDHCVQLCSSLEVVRWRPAMQLPNRCSKRRGHEWRKPTSVDARFGILRPALLSNLKRTC